MKLWLEIEPEDCEPFEVKDTSTTISTGSDNNYKTYHPVHDVRLAGMVKAWIDIEGYSTVVLLGVKNTDINVAINPAKMPYGNTPKLTGRIIKAHKAGTLPAELYANTDDPTDTRLREVPV